MLTLNYHGVLQYYIFILDLILLYVSVVSFNHRSVYPLFFDGTVIEKWWLSALVIKVYCKAAGQKVVSDEGFVISSLRRCKLMNYYQLFCETFNIYVVVVYDSRKQSFWCNAEDCTSVSPGYLIDNLLFIV